MRKEKEHRHKHRKGVRREAKRGREKRRKNEEEGGPWKG